MQDHLNRQDLTRRNIISIIYKRLPLKNASHQTLIDKIFSDFQNSSPSKLRLSDFVLELCQLPNHSLVHEKDDSLTIDIVSID